LLLHENEEWYIDSEKDIALGEEWHFEGIDGVWVLTPTEMNTKVKPPWVCLKLEKELEKNRIKKDYKMVCPGDFYTYIEKRNVNGTDTSLVAIFFDGIFGGVTSDFIRLTLRKKKKSK